MDALCRLTTNALQFLFPTCCVHCEGNVRWPTHQLCAHCFEQIEWIDRKERCPSCHGPRKCKRCLPLHPHRSLFENTGPIASLYHDFLQTKRGRLLASLIVVALSKTSWPHPEAIVPLTIRPFPKTDPAYFLAKEVAQLLGCPLLLPSEKVEGKNVLFLTPLLASGSAFFEEKKRLAGFFPSKILTCALIDTRR